MVSGKGKVRLKRPSELDEGWNPATDARRTVWEATHQLIRVLEAEGEEKAATSLAQLGSDGEVARELAYLLYAICEKRRRAAEGRSYNGLVQSWPSIQKLSNEPHAKAQAQPRLL